MKLYTNAGEFKQSPTMQKLTDSIDKVVRAAMNARMEPMERACEFVMMLGYSFGECMLEHHRPDMHPVGHGWTERDVLVVRGVPAFEVVTTFADFKFTTTSRVLTWPAPRAPEHAPALAGGREA